MNISYKIHMIKSSLFFPILLFLPACSFLKSDVKEINSVQEVKIIFEQASQDDLFVFDVDDVLLEPIEPVMQAWFRNNPKLGKINDDFFAFLKTKKNAQEYEDLFISKINLKIKDQPIEKALVDAILTLQKKNIKVIALTALPSGKLGLIDRQEKWRYQQLMRLGLDFSQSFFQQEIKFDELQKTESAAKFKAKKGRDPTPAIFYKGITCTSCFPKGIVLKAFLEKIGIYPAHVYFFDDRKKHVESVVRGMKDMGVACQAFVYKAATANRPTKDIDINKVAKIAKFQYELMKQRDDAEYISYFEAKEILEQQKSLSKIHVRPIQATS